MIYLISVLIPLAMIVGLFMLVVYEERKNVRFFQNVRSRMDGYADKIAFIAEHVDFVSFARDVAQRMVHRAIHDTAHISLLIVRAVERLLTRIVKRLRAAHTTPPPQREQAREFVQTLSNFKDSLNETRPIVPDIMEQ